MARLLTIAAFIVAISSCLPSSASFSAEASPIAAVNHAEKKEKEAAPPALISGNSNNAAASSSSNKADTPRFPLRALPPLNINASSFTISGISAGGAMAVQFEIAYSRIVKAGGTIAGVPYMCSQLGGAVYALSCMSSPYQINQDVLFDFLNGNLQAGTIDDVENLKSHMTMVFSGLTDTVVRQGTVMIIDEMFKKLGVAKRFQVYNITAEHSWVTNDFGEACSFLGAPYINNCDYDFGGIFLNRAFNFMGLPPLQPKGLYNPANLFKFSQADFGASALISMDTVAFAYIPTACQSGAVQCHLHVNFHGCNQQRSAFPLEEDLYVSHTGLNKWAESNNIVILYPQTIASILMPLNPQGCFDWWGYTDMNYANQKGLQMNVIRDMIRAIGGF